MKHFLLPEKNGTMHYYRANLHCHSTISDGSKTVEELKRDYMAHGYSAIAFTDHDIYLTHNELTDESFVALNGYELEVTQDDPPEGESAKTAHVCLVALEQDNDKAVCYHRTKYIGDKSSQYRPMINFDDRLPDFERVYTPECVNEIIKTAKENGFFVTYNHPTWSLESYPEYSAFRGMDAMEIQNFSSVVSGWDDDNGHCYEDLLRQGNRLYAVAADDNHNRHDDDDPHCDSYGGYVMIAADELKYEKLTSSLKNGTFYASTGDYKKSGPEILSLEYEDGQVRIKTTPARYIAVTHNTRNCSSAYAKDGESVIEAVFNIDKNAKWFRLTVIDNQGFKAYTRAYFLDELK